MVVRFLVCVFMASTMLLSGCGNNVTPLTKYDSKSTNRQKNAVVVIGAKNISFLDIARYSGYKHSAKQPTATPKPMSTTTAKTTKTERSVASADPNNQTYNGERYDLRRLFKKKDSNSDSDATSENEPQTTTEPQQESEPTTQIASDKEFRIHRQSSFFSLFSYAKSTYVLQPGIYYIAFAFYDPNLDSNPNADTDFTRYPGVGKDGLIQYGAFEVKAGQVLYVGDLNLNWVDQYAKDFVTVTDNLKQVQQDLIEAGDRDLAAQIIKAKFYPQGSRIVQNSEGNTLQSK